MKYSSITSFAAVKRGDILRHKDDCESVVVVAHLGDAVILSRTTHASNPSEWLKIERETEEEMVIVSLEKLIRMHRPEHHELTFGDGYARLYPRIDKLGRHPQKYDIIAEAHDERCGAIALDLLTEMIQMEAK